MVKIFPCPYLALLCWQFTVGRLLDVSVVSIATISWVCHALFSPTVTRFTIATEAKILKSLACFTRHVCWEVVWIARVCYAEVLKTICVYSLCIFRTALLCPPGLPLETGGGYEISNAKQFIVLLIWCDRRFLVCNNLFVDFIRANEFLSQYQSWLKFQINFGDLSQLRFNFSSILVDYQI